MGRTSTPEWGTLSLSPYIHMEENGEDTAVLFIMVRAIPMTIITTTTLASMHSQLGR
jgi:hypothetical protein